MKTLSIDIETYSSVNLAKAGVYRYVESPDFEILLFGYSMDGDSVHVIDLACGDDCRHGDYQRKIRRRHMNTDACIKKIEKYLAKSNVGVLVVDVQNSADLSEIVTHFNVSGNTFVASSDYCKTDELPPMDTLLDVLARKEEPLFLTGLSSFFKLQGEEELRSELANLLSMTIAGHVVVLTFQCKGYLNFPDPRLSGRICIVEGSEDVYTKLVFTSGELPLPTGITLINGIHALGEAIETKNAAAVYVSTAKERKTFPNSLYLISDLKRAFDALLFKDATTSVLDEMLGTDAQWKYALGKFKRESSWAALIIAEFGDSKTLDLVILNFNSFDNDKKWLYFIGLKLYGAKNNWCLDTAASKATGIADLVHHAYRDILEIDPASSIFANCYNTRKALLNTLGNPLDDVTAFCKIVISKEKAAIYYLTDNTQQEKETVFFLLDKYGLEFRKDELYDILKTVYPKLYAYLSPFRFKNKLLDEYFQAYKFGKVINKVLPDFEAVVTEQAEKRDYNSILAPRASRIETIDKRGAQLYFVDALGVEYLGFIMSLCRERGMMARVDVCRCELPSITSRNKEFIDAFSSSGQPVISIKDIDDIKHHGKDDYDYRQVKLPIYLTQELAIIEDVIDKIKVRLANGTIQKAIIVSDHGASRLAVIHETENQWQMDSNGVHSGRCCPKSEIDVQPDFATDADDFWALANYDRFKGGRKANFEVHGGATLEEVTIPIIEITYTPGKIEIRLMPLDAAAGFIGTPEITVSYRKKAAMKLFSTKTLQDVTVCISGKYYDAIPIDDNFYSMEMPDIKRARQYTVDVYSCGNLVASDLPIVVKSEGSSVKDLL